MGQELEIKNLFGESFFSFFFFVPELADPLVVSAHRQSMLMQIVLDEEPSSHNCTFHHMLK